MNAFAILSEPVRRRILEQLSSRSLSSGEVVDIIGNEFGIGQSAVSQHLKVLRDNGFATVQVDGTRRIYALDTTGLQDIDQWLTPFRRFWEPRFQALAKEVERGKRARKQNP
ncbi:MAG: metalloregulator ArsR/SmtB family transcription factor [Planctomycetota bacterium]